MRPPAQPANAHAAAAPTISAPIRPASTRRSAVRPGTLRVPPRELLDHLAERDAPRAEQHQRVEPEVGRLRDEPPVALAPERRGDHLGRLLADLAADLARARREELRHKIGEEATEVITAALGGEGDRRLVAE